MFGFDVGVPLLIYTVAVFAAGYGLAEARNHDLHHHYEPSETVQIELSKEEPPLSGQQ